MKKTQETTKKAKFSFAELLKKQAEIQANHALTAEAEKPRKSAVRTAKNTISIQANILYRILQAGEKGIKFTELMKKPLLENSYGGGTSFMPNTVNYAINKVAKIGEENTLPLQKKMNEAGFEVIVYYSTSWEEVSIEYTNKKTGNVETFTKGNNNTVRIEPLTVSEAIEYLQAENVKAEQIEEIEKQYNL